MCVQVEGHVSGWTTWGKAGWVQVDGRGGGLGGSTTILNIYKKGVYKNVQVDSSVFPKNPELGPLG